MRHNPLCNYAIKSYSTFVTVAKEKAQINTSLLGLAKVAQILNVGLCCLVPSMLLTGSESDKQVKATNIKQTYRRKWTCKHYPGWHLKAWIRWYNRAKSSQASGENNRQNQENLKLTSCSVLEFFFAPQASSVLPADTNMNLTSNLIVCRNGLPFFFCPLAFSWMQLDIKSWTF